MLSASRGAPAVACGAGAILPSETMFGVKTRFDSLPVVVAFVSLLLTGLAFLQYRWTGDLSEAERGRMRASLNERATRMARELDREITRAFVGLSVEAEMLRTGDYSAFAERYDRWRALATDPALVKDIYVARAEGGAEAEPLRYSPERRTFEPSAWPPAVAAARDRTPSEGGERRPRPFFGPLELLEDGTPIARMPTPTFERGPRPPWSAGREAVWATSERATSGPRPGAGPGPEGGSVSYGVMRVAGFAVLVFDRDVILSKLLPRLAARHFSEGTESGFDLTVARRDQPEHIIYRSSGPPGGKAEASSGLLELRFEEIGEEELRALGGPFMARAEARRGPGPPDRRGFAGRFFRGPGPEAGGLWVLEVAYRGGSVEALVAAARRRNLAVSFSVLLLLGAATVLAGLGGAPGAAHGRATDGVRGRGVPRAAHSRLGDLLGRARTWRTASSPGPRECTRYGALVRDEGRRLARLIEQILDFAGSYTGRRRLPPRAGGREAR